MKLREVFTSIAVKKLVGVDLPLGISHQHELNGVIALQSFFHTPDDIHRQDITWHYFSDDDFFSTNGTFSFYDARRNHPTRTEWRFYYHDNPFEKAQVDDIFILANSVDKGVIGIIVSSKSGWLYTICKIFNLRITELENKFVIIDDRILINELSIIETQFFEALGISLTTGFEGSVERIAEKELDIALKSNLKFPKPERLAKASQDIVNKLGINNPDDLLIAYLEKETEIFYCIERKLLEVKLENRFETVEDFINFSLSIQNRRKSRRGISFQNQLEALFVISLPDTLIQ